jgi:hypothetical protein
VICLLIGKVWPEPTSSAAGRRTLDVITALSMAGWRVHCACAAHPGEHAADLSALGVTSHPVAVNDSRFDTWIAALAPDLVIFDRFMTEEQFGWRVARCCPEALRVLDTSDLHCLRLARQAALRDNTPPELINETALREIAAIYRSDCTLMISEYEIDRLREDFSIAGELLAYWPFSVSLGAPVAGFAERSHCMMIGSFLHPPNLDAVRWCREAIWPLLREALPEAELHLYGSYGERFAGELHAPQAGVFFKGRAGDALETMADYRLNLAPLRYGAGLKGKVFDGFLSGTPTVMTPIAAEGITLGGAWGQAEPEAFAAEAVRLYASAEAWQRRQAAERALCQDRFNAQYWQPRLSAIIEEALREKAARRKRNFIGQVLQHHHHRSTEYMSRWIEAKNQ